jgi:hypothetical protein
MIPFIILSYKFSRNPISKSFYGLGILLTLIVSLLTYSRGGFLGLITVFIVLIAYSKNKVPIIMIGLILAIISSLFIGNDWLVIMSSSTDLNSPTAITRITMWDATWKVFLDNPIGVGTNNIPVLAHEHIPDGILGRLSYTWQDSVAHSFWLTALAEWGFIGFILLLKIIWLNIKDCYRLSRIYIDSYESAYLNLFGVSALASFTGFLVSSSFLTVNYYPHFWYMTSIIWAAIGIQYSIATGKDK